LSGETVWFLTSERLRFRTWRPGDVELAMALWGDPEVTRFIAVTPASRADVEVMHPSYLLSRPA
jgi:hypothetical protein